MRTYCIHLPLLALQARFHLRRWLLPARKLLRGFRNWAFFLFSFPPFRSLSLLLFLKCRWQFLLRLEALFFIVTSVCSAGSCQVLFLCLSRSSSLGAFFAVLRVGLRRLLGLGSVVPVDLCSWCGDCDACWSWWSACSCCCAWCAWRAWRAWSYAASGGFPL